MMPPLANSYWIEVGHLLAGEHPFVGDEESTQKRIARMVEAGVRHFIDLTQPGEMNSYRAFLPAGCTYHNFPIEDHSVPTGPEVMRDCLIMLEEMLRESGACYVHCRAGIGRTATVVGCFLRERGDSPTGALDQLNRLWQFNARAEQWPSIPETDEQWEYVRRWVPGRLGLQIGADTGIQKPRLRLLGSVLGLAVGDVLAQLKPGDTPPIGWTDDTAMTLCVVESHLMRNGFDGRDQLERFRLWSLDPQAHGANPSAKLRPSVRETLGRAAWTRTALAGSHDPTVVDPAPLARVAAAAWIHPEEIPAAAALASDISRVTHQATFVVDTCRVFAGMVAAALQGRDFEGLLQAPSELGGPALKPEVQKVVNEWLAPPTSRRAVPAAILGCLDRAIRALARAENFSEGMERLLSAPGTYPDATFSAYGALAGAFFGETSVPHELRAAVAGIERLETLADRLYLKARSTRAAWS